jgi:hypothetical protein
MLRARLTLRVAGRRPCIPGCGTARTGPGNMSARPPIDCMSAPPCTTHSLMGGPPEPATRAAERPLLGRGATVWCVDALGRRRISSKKGGPVQRGGSQPGSHSPLLLA